LDYNRRNEHLDETSLFNRGDDQHGTPYAPCGLYHANGYDYAAQGRPYVCVPPCPAEEQKRCPQRFGVRGYCHRMRFKDHPRLIGPIQRGSTAWHDLYGLAVPVNAPTAMIKRLWLKLTPCE
jgi:hypothetical protein